MSHQLEKHKKGILKADQDHIAALGAYNLYTKRASFKDDVILQQIILDQHTGEEPTTVATVEQHFPIASDESSQAVTLEELKKKEEFKIKRKVVDQEGAEGLDLRAVLAHRVQLTEEEDDANEAIGITDSSAVAVSETDPMSPSSSSITLSPCDVPTDQVPSVDTTSYKTSEQI